MGLINLDSYTTQYGYEITNTYIGIGDNEISIRKEEGGWLLEVELKIWHSKEHRDAKKEPYDTIYIYKGLSDSDITTNLFSIIYTEVKQKFTNTVDDI